MTWTMATGFILGIGISALIGMIGAEIYRTRSTNNTDVILNLIEEIERQENTIDELMRENKGFKKVIGKWEERDNEFR